MSRALHPRADVDHSYLPRSHGGRGLKNVEDVVKEEKCGVYEYLTPCEDPWLQIVLRAGLFKSPSFSNTQHFRSAMIERRWSSYLDKPLHDHYFRVCHQIVDLSIDSLVETLLFRLKVFLLLFKIKLLQQEQCNISSIPPCPLYADYVAKIMKLYNTC